jgi:uncharacterized membrane protein
MPTRRGAPRSTFERFYSVVVAIKGIDGLVETVAGLLLLLAPRLTGSALESLAAELAEGTSPLRDAASRSIASAGGGLVTGAAPLALFLLVHGIVKLLTVTALLRRAVRWYPWALAVLCVLFLVQLADLITAPAIGGWVLVGLDVVVIVLVAWEYERLRRERTSSVVRDRAHRSERASAR